MKTKYQVSGMTCGGCSRALVNALAQAGIMIKQQDVSVAEGSVVVDSGVQKPKLQAAVEAAGFQLGGQIPVDVSSNQGNDNDE